MPSHKEQEFTWLRLHDRYDAGGHVDMTGRYHAPEEPHACCATGKEVPST